MEFIRDMPDSVAAVNGKGKLTGEDYKSVLIPAIEDLLTRHDKIRLLCCFDDDFSFDGSAIWQDTTFGLKHLTKWEKLAIVTDKDWLRHSTSFLSFMVPGEVKVFTNAQLEAAKVWIAA